MEIYDTIGDSYLEVPNLPTGQLQLSALKALLGDINGLTILEVACGGGFFSRKTIEWGALNVVGLDISEAMVDTARRQAQGDDRLRFYVADCSQPLNVGQFDIVMAPWLLNYSKNKDQLLNMWRSMHDSLKPGGRLVGISPNLDWLDDISAFPQGPQFGQELKVVGQIDDWGLEIQVTMHTSHPFSFNNYYLPRALYEKCGELAGMRDIQWTDYNQKKPLVENVDWEQFLQCPPFKTFTAIRPGYSGRL